MFRLLLSAILASLLALPAAAEDMFRPATVIPIGAPHACNGFYPEAARLAHVEGVTALDFHIDVNGAVSHVRVAKSSGSEDLDDAAASCVRTWRYIPTLKDGKPVEVLWSAETEWRVPAAPPPPPAPLTTLTERDNDCFHYPFWPERKHIGGTATVKFSISADGLPGDVVLSKESGNADLDKAALECVNSMRFRVPDATKHMASATATWSTLGRPKAVHWQFVGFLGSEAMETITELRTGIKQCLKGMASHSEFSSGFGGTTVIWATYDRGKIDEVSVLRSSGNDPLDRFAVECFKSEPPDEDQVHTLRHIGKVIFEIRWSRYLVP